MRLQTAGPCPCGCLKKAHAHVGSRPSRTPPKPRARATRGAHRNDHKTLGACPCAVLEEGSGLRAGPGWHYGRLAPINRGVHATLRHFKKLMPANRGRAPLCGSRRGSHLLFNRECIPPCGILKGICLLTEIAGLCPCAVPRKGYAHRPLAHVLPRRLFLKAQKPRTHA